MRRTLKAAATTLAIAAIASCVYNAGAATTPECHAARALNPAAVCGVDWLKI